MMTQVFLMFLFCTIRVKAATLNDGDCVGLECHQIVSIPLIDSMRATLKADLDVTEMNKILQRYINDEIKSRVASVLNESVHDLVASSMERTMDILTHDLKDSLTGPAFFVSLKKHPYVLSGRDGVVKFDDVRVNRHGGYDPSTGKFTAPKQGLYHFTCLILGDYNHVVHYALSKNNSRITAGYSTKGSHTSSTISALVEMAKGEYASITHRVEASEQIYGNHHSSFAGYFLQD